MADVLIRKTIPLSAQEAQLVEQAREAGNSLHEALLYLVGFDATRSEAATLHALLSLAFATLREEAAHADYARLAAALDDEDNDFECTMRSRQRDR